MNYWYAAQPDEIFLDLDSNRATARALSVLRLALRRRHLRIESVWLYSTPTRGHAHLIIQLKEAMDFHTRMAWSLWMGNDRLRVAYVLERQRRGIRNADLLISTERYYRTPNAFCRYRKKHKDSKVTSKCPAMEHLLGQERNAD